MQIYDDCRVSVIITLTIAMMIFCLCSTDKECATSPCKNGGTCIEKMDKTGYRCVCKDGFAGKDCLQCKYFYLHTADDYL